MNAYGSHFEVRHVYSMWHIVVDDAVNSTRPVYWQVIDAATQKTMARGQTDTADQAWLAARNAIDHIESWCVLKD